MSIPSGIWHPLRDSAERLSALDARTGFRVCSAELDGWRPLPALAERSVAGEVLDGLPASTTGKRNVATAQFAAGLACCVVRPLMAMLRLDARVPSLSPDTVQVSPRYGRPHSLALAPVKVHGLPGDPAAGHPDLLAVANPAELDAHAAQSIHTTLEPIMHTLRTEGRYGLPQLWGAVLDMIGATSLLAARIGGLDQQRSWQRAQRLCGMVAQLAEQPRASHPRPLLVEWSGGEALYTVKGTCCLQYREYGLRAGEAADTAAYCKTCPFISERARAARCTAQLERDPAQAARGHVRVRSER